jgi:hypothetical protein
VTDDQRPVHRAGIEGRRGVLPPERVLRVARLLAKGAVETLDQLRPFDLRDQPVGKLQVLSEIIDKLGEAAVGRLPDHVRPHHQHALRLGQQCVARMPVQVPAVDVHYLRNVDERVFAGQPPAFVAKSRCLLEPRAAHLGPGFDGSAHRDSRPLSPRL